MRQTSRLSIVGQRDAGGCVVTSFGIIEGREHDAAEALVKLLDEGHEVFLANDLDDDEGREGGSVFRSTASGYARRDGGHGWQGDWTALDGAGIRAAIIALAGLNRGQDGSRQGMIERRK